MEVSGQFHVLAALTPWKEPPLTIGYKAEWAPEPIWTFLRILLSPSSGYKMLPCKIVILPNYCVLKVIVEVRIIAVY
jgi:hypothetical protein